MSGSRRLPTTPGIVGAAATIAIILLGSARPLWAQSDTARVSYRTREIVFVTAGRDEGLGVGDTISVVRADGTTATLAVVVSVARHTASARLLTADASIDTGMRVTFTRHAAAEVAAEPAADSAAAAPDTAYHYTYDTVQTMAPPSRLRGGISLEQYASSAGATGALRTNSTLGALDLEAPFGAGATFLLRGNGRWRNGDSRLLTGADAFTALLYRAELRLGAPGAAWSASLGRFLPSGAMGLGYLDGARLELRPSPSQRIGFIGGVVPKIEQLRPSTDTKRAGAYWAFGAPGSTVDGSILAAADFGGGQRRRTEIAAQTFWRIASRATASVYGEVDLPVSGTAQAKAQLTTFYASLHAALPLGFRGGLNVESHDAFQVWNADLQPDTTLPAPGRLTGAGFSLGHDVFGLSLDLSGGMLKRQGDAQAALRGSFTASRGAFFLTAFGQHGDLMDYGSVMARILVPPRVLPFTMALGAAVSMTRTPGGGMTFWRYSLRPEVSRYLGGGVFASLGGDIGRYAGQTSTWLHAGVSYRLR